MLEEAVEVIRGLWQGDVYQPPRPHFTVENARLYTLPERLPPIHVAASGTRMAEFAGRIGDGLIGTAPDADLLAPTAGQVARALAYGQVTLCWAKTRASRESDRLSGGRRLPCTARSVRNFRTPPSSPTRLQPHRGQVAEAITVRPRCGRHVKQIQGFIDAGYDHVYLHQIGPDQEGFLRLRGTRAPAGPRGPIATMRVLTRAMPAVDRQADQDAALRELHRSARGLPPARAISFEWRTKAGVQAVFLVVKPRIH